MKELSIKFKWSVSAGWTNKALLEDVPLLLMMMMVICITVTHWLLSFDSNNNNNNNIIVCRAVITRLMMVLPQMMIIMGSSEFVVTTTEKERFCRTNEESEDQYKIIEKRLSVFFSISDFAELLLCPSVQKQKRQRSTLLTLSDIALKNRKSRLSVAPF